MDFHASANLDTLSFLGDASLIGRMLHNLLYNCVLHNPNGCQIHVSVNLTSTHFNYVILDDGCGFSDKQLDQFNANYFSNNKYLSNGETAHGFGLRLVWQIIEAYLGKITFKNGEKGGAIVEVTFPLNSQI